MNDKQEGVDGLGVVPADCFKSQNPCGGMAVTTPSIGAETAKRTPGDFDQEADDPRFDCNCLSYGNTAAVILNRS